MHTRAHVATLVGCCCRSVATVGTPLAANRQPPRPPLTCAWPSYRYALLLPLPSRCLGLAEAGHSESLALCPAALPRTAYLGAAAAAPRCCRVRTTGTTPVATLALPLCRRRVHADPLQLYAIASPTRVASAVCTGVSRCRHAIYGTAARGPRRSDTRTRCP